MQHKPKIMGILNITSDSYFNESRAMSEKEIAKRLETLVSEGTDIIDIGACSTRPGAKLVESKEEWDNLSRALTIINKSYPDTLISIDTFRSEIVRKSFDLIGPFIINDISAGEDDKNMLQTVAKLGLEYVAMHKRGTPETMQNHCQYADVVGDIIDYFKDFEQKATNTGITNWILDPGFGFSKTIEQNYELLDRLDEFKILQRPILIGISRKSFIYKKLNTTPENVLKETTELHKLAISKGANILRVHDVAEAKNIL